MNTSNENFIGKGTLLVLYILVIIIKSYYCNILNIRNISGNSSSHYHHSLITKTYISGLRNMQGATNSLNYVMSQSTVGLRQKI